MIRVVLVDDQLEVRQGLRTILGSCDDIDVIGEAADGAQAVDLVGVTRPDVVVMDIRMPRMDGIEATRQILASNGGVRVLVLTTFDLDTYVFGALRAGAAGFLLKDAEPDELQTAVQTVAAGHALVAPEVTRRLIEEFVESGAGLRSNAAVLDQLTDREREVLRLVGSGRSNQEIADDLVIEITTVKTHVRRVFAKLGLRDRVAAVILAHDTGLVRRGQDRAGD